MLKRQPWRRLVHRFSAVTILLSVLSVGSVVFAPASGAATTQTTIPGKNPKSPLCRKTRSEVLTARRELSDLLQKAKSGTWNAYQASMLAGEKQQFQFAQAVINLNRGVPTNVSTAARQAEKNAMAMDKLIRKSKNMAALDASLNASGAGLLTAWITVFYYVGGQCGLKDSEEHLGTMVKSTETTVGGTTK